MPVRAVVFDLDGTLVDNMPLHQQAFDAFARRHELAPLTPEMRRRLDGKRNRDIFPILFDRQLSAEELRRFAEEKEDLYRRLSAGRLQPLAGLLEFLDQLDRRGLPFAIATSAPAGNVPHTLGELGLQARFPVVVRSEQMARGKPYPDVFLEAARLLGADPHTCLAFEDAFTGIEAAAAAGMAPIAITTTFSAADFRAHGRAHYAVSNYHDWMRNVAADDPD